MVYLSIVLGIISVFCFIKAIFHKNTKSIFLRSDIILGFGIGLVGLLFFIFSTITVIESGKVGVPVLFGKVQPKPLTEGLHIANPFYKIYYMSVRTENYWMSHVSHEGQNSNIDDSVLVRSSNGLPMPVDVSIPYRLIPENACWVYQNLGANYIEKILRPALSTALRREAALFTAEELYSSKRDEFAIGTQEKLEDELNKILSQTYPDAPKNIIVFSQVLIGHVGIPESVKVAIENKLKADQEQQAMEFTIMKEQKESERKQIEALGIQKFQEIVTQGISEPLLRWKAIEATLKLSESHNAKVVVIGGQDGLPIILGNDK